MVVNKPTHPNAEITNFIQRCLDWDKQHENPFKYKYIINNKVVIPFRGPSLAIISMQLLPIKLTNLRYKEYLFKNPEIILLDHSACTTNYHIQIDEIKRIN